MAEKTTTEGGNVSMKLKTWVSNVSRDGTSVSADVHVSMKVTNEWTSNQMAAWIFSNGTKYELRAPHVEGDYSEHSTSVRKTWTNVSLTATSLTYTVGFGWNAWNASQGTTLSETFSFNPAVIWNDINAYHPDQSTQGGLIFNLTTSDGGSWTNLTNEPSSFTKLVGTTATVSNIRSNVTGAHYSGNNVTNSTASSFTWTFNTADWVCKIYTAWDQYTITYDGNGGIARGIGDQTKTYNVSLKLRGQTPIRNNHEFLGWSKDPNATTATWGAGDSFTENATNNGDTITLYAIWKPLYYDFDLKILTPEGVESKNATTLGSVKMSVNDGSYTTVIDEPNPQYLYTSTFKFKDVKLAPGLRLSSVTGATWDSTNQVYTTTQPAKAKVVTFQTAYKGSKVKVNNNWKSGNVYVKVNGSWVAAKTVYIKRNGSWVEIPYKDINT